tara:strand:+ start:1918 stop:2103 length:186 start_codon:yes stop_codon:yes gene_type:complete
MQFQKNTSVGKSGNIIKILIKVTFVFLLFFISLILIDKIDFPSPYKKIEKVIPYENLKIVK